MTLNYIITICLGFQIAAAEESVGQSAATVREIHDPSSKTILIAAHRGGYENDKADGAPENSVANILNCQSKGYELYETDIQRTIDGHFVIIHDATINRESNGKGSASSIGLADMKHLRKKYRDGSLSEETVATLEEFLSAGKGCTIFKADLKPGVVDHFKKIMQLVIKYDALDGIIFRVPYRQADQFAQFKADGVPWVKSLLMFMVSKREQVDDIKARFDPLTIQINVSKSDPANPKTLELIRYASSQGLLVETHAEGDEKDWAKLIDAGVRMFHTKKPSKIRAFLAGR